MNSIIENWYMIVLALSFVLILVTWVIRYAKADDAEQERIIEQLMQDAKEWAVWACVQAEIKWGSKTGQMKLRDVYNGFVVAFPALTEYITFNDFDAFIKVSLEKAKAIIENNEAVKNLVNGEDA